jgi:hypothetical protein
MSAAISGRRMERSREFQVMNALLAQNQDRRRMAMMLPPTAAAIGRAGRNG